MRKTRCLPGIFPPAHSTWGADDRSGSADSGSDDGLCGPAEAVSAALLAAVNRFRFFVPVAPNTPLRIETSTLTQAGALAIIEGTITANGEKVASGELSVVSGR